MTNRARVAVGLASLACLSIGVPTAEAAIYEVHACRLRTGGAAPANGWSTTSGAIATIDCPGGVMTVRARSGTMSPGSRYGVEFHAPSGTTIVGIRRRVEGDVVQVPGAPPPWSWIFSESGTPVGEDSSVLREIREFGNVGRFSDAFEFPFPRPLTRFLFSLKCDDTPGMSGPCQENGSYFNVRQVAMKLNDSTPPRILSASGSFLSGGGPQKGQLHLALKLNDVGGGLYRTRVLVDGEPMEDRVIDDNQGACKAPFVVPAPCKLSAMVDVPIDTTRLSEGTHSIVVRVLDATSVNSAAIGPVAIVVDNLPDPPPRGTAACPAQSVAKVQGRLNRHVVRYGRSVSIAGRVIASRPLLKGAHVGVVDNPSIAGRPRLTRVGRRGRFHIKVRPRQSTRIQPILVSSAGLAQACGKAVKLAVRAGVRLTADPPHLRNGQAIRFRGRVTDVRLPQQGKTVAIQARAQGAASWTTVTLMRTDAAGHFKFAYRFRKTFQTTTYEFRAVAPRERGYPFRRGWSRVRRATVSP